jgi:hypothetical protein
MNQNPDMQVATPNWLSDLTPQEMESVAGGALLRRKALNRWLFKFQRTKLNIPATTTRVTSLLTDTVNRQANLDLSNQFHAQLTTLEGSRLLADNLYRTVGLPVPN